MLHISSAFDGGNIECLSCASADDIQLHIRRDNQADFLQWFYFRLIGARDTACRLRLLNAGQASYAKGFEGYQAVASYDRHEWFRVPSHFDGEVFTIEHTPEQDAIYYAYFAPYSMERHHDFVAWAVQSERVQLLNAGCSVEGQVLDLLRIGEGEGKQHKKVIWAIARQHPGETMAEWWMEGFIAKLLDESDPVARALLARADIYVVPNMNPDGSCRGNLRTNAAGRNLNREWLEPSETDSPEVFHVRAAMQRSGVDICLDVHGDEVLPYNFIAGADGIPAWNEARERELNRFRGLLMGLNPDFQCRHGYPVAAPGEANMTMCTKYVGATFGALAMTLEMPFKDTADSPDPQVGWSPARCQRLGESCVEALYQYLQG